MFTVLGFHKNSCASIFVHLKKTHIFIRIHKFMHRLVMPYLFIFSLRWRLNFVGLINKIHENWCSTNTNETTVFVFFGNTATISVQMLFWSIYLWRLYQSFFVSIADDKSVTSDEFLLDWMERHLGSSLEAVILFHHLDVDRNGHIEETDIPWILAFFDRNSKVLSFFLLKLTVLLIDHGFVLPLKEREAKLRVVCKFWDLL